MNLDDITVADFKAQFVRVFPFIPVYDNTKLYNAGARVYYGDTELFYDCTVNGTQGILPTVTTNWTQVEDDVFNYVQDSDIERAFKEAKQTFNQGLWGDDDSITLGYLYLTAFWLAYDLKAALAGMMANASMPMTSRSVGNVSESYGIPQSYLNDPVLGIYTSNPWGLKYLGMAIPRLRGNMVAVAGATRP